MPIKFGIHITLLGKRHQQIIDKQVAENAGALPPTVGILSGLISEQVLDKEFKN